MKIICERCRAEYDVPDAKIPPSGFKMTCPACNNEIKVAAAAPAPPAPSAPREIALSEIDEEPELPAAKVAAPAAPAISEAALAEPDFSATVADEVPQVAAADEPELPAPVFKKAPPMLRPPGKAAAPEAPDVVDLPAPRGKKPTPKPAVDGGVDLLAPKAKAPPPLRPPKPVKPATGPEVIDLPAPVTAGLVQPRGSVLDVPRPKAPRAASAGPPSVGPPAVDDADYALPLDLDAPDADDALQPVYADLVQPKPDGSIDLPTPLADGSVGLPTPRPDGSIDLPTPRPDGSIDLPMPRAQPAPRDAKSVSRPAAAAAERPSGGGKKKLIFAGVGVVVLAAGGFAAMQLTGGGGKAELAAKLAAAKKALADDSAAGLRKAAAELKPLTAVEKPADDALTVEAQARLVLVRLGASAELTPAKALLDRPVEGEPSPERKRALALRSLVAGDAGAARKACKDILAAAPTDAAALDYLGWTELLSRDFPTALTAFEKAVAVEAGRAQAIYGVGLVKERLGDDTAAKAAYAKVVAAVPDHARAKLGVLRIDVRAALPDAAVKLEAYVAEHAGNFAPREQAEGMVALGNVALAAGRRDEAEDRFKKALGLDADPKTSLISSDAQLGLARTLIDIGRGAEAIEGLRKVLAVDGRGLEVRVLITEALLDKQSTDEATTFLEAAEKIAPKDARIAFLRGRMLVSHSTVSKEERTQAIERFRQATAADPKLLAAWAALARNLHEIGKDAEAVEALDKAAATLTTDPTGAALIGSAYLAIGRPAEAETRFRTVLAGDGDKVGGAERLPVWLGLGEALEAQGKLEAAQAAYGDAQKIAPKSAALLERRARLALRGGKLDEARALFDEAIQQGNPTVPLRLAAADLALRGDRMQDARTLVDSVLKDDERSAFGTLLMARIELATGHPDEAMGLARRASTLSDMPEAHLIHGELLEKLGKLDAAAAELLLAKREPTVTQASLAHARVLVRQGATKDALTELAPLVKAGAFRAEALMLSGDSYADLQQADKALRAYDEAAKLQPNSADAAFKVGRAQLDAGKRGPALAALDRALKLAPPKTEWIPDAYLLIGDARRQGKESDAAIKAYTKYLELAPRSAAMRTEATRQIQLLGGTPPGP